MNYSFFRHKVAKIMLLLFPSKTICAMWKVYALLSALFAAQTAICAKVGVKNINSDLATAIRTSVILILTWGIVFFEKHQTEVRELSHHTWLFLILSGVATGLSWLFYLGVVFTIIFAFLFLHERVGLPVVIGAILIAAGSILMLSR